MLKLRILLSISFLLLLIYTIQVIYNHGLNLFPLFFGDMASFTWSGQFNLDFSFFLIISGIWAAWRNKFNNKGNIFGVLTLVGGMLFFSGYLLFLTYKSQGSIQKLLIGENQGIFS